MIFQHFLVDVNESNSFVLGCDETRDALLVDIGGVDLRIDEFIETERLRLSVVFITHDHFDHTGGLGSLLARHDAEVLSGAGHAGGPHGRIVSHGDTVQVGKLTGMVLATPGHTPDSISLAFPGLVFTGDALFSGSIGGTSSPRNAQQEIDHVRKNIFSLPDDDEIHPGHGPSSTVAIERNHNPFFV